MEKQILVIGSLNMDLTVSIKRLPKEGETLIADDLMYHLGGKGANQACAAARLGGRVKMLGCVGNDGFGNRQMEELTFSGVDVSDIKRSRELPTGTAVICVDEIGNNCIMVIRGANLACDVAYIRAQETVISRSDYVLLQMEIPQDALYQAIRLAKANGKTVILNPAPAPDAIPDEILRSVDYLTPNETELFRLAGMEAEGTQPNKEENRQPDCPDSSRLQQAIKTGAQRLIDRGVSRVIVTMGSEGYGIFGREKSLFFPALPVTAVDTTAAGDCFNGAFAAALADGLDENEAAAYANRASAIAVTRMGAQSSLPVREELYKT